MRDQANNETSIIVGGGIGDALAFDAWYFPKEKEFSNVYHMGLRPKICEPIYAKYPNFKRFVHFWDVAPQIWTPPEELSDVIQFMKVPIFLAKSLIKEVRNTETPTLRKYTPTTFIKNKVADISGFNLPRKYVVICPYTINKNKARDWADRKFDGLAWKQVQIISDDIDVVVLGIDCEIPDLNFNGKLTNLSDKTSILEAVEITKKCRGYFGVDSSMSVIAAQCLPTDHRYNMLVFPKGGWLYYSGKMYYGPKKARIVEEFSEFDIKRFIKETTYNKEIV